MKPWAVMALLLLLPLITTGCTSQSTPGRMRQAAGSPEPVPTAQPTRTATGVGYLVTGGADGGQGCSPDEITHRAAAMFDTLSRGGSNVVDDCFGRRRNAPFEWYPMTEHGTREDRPAAEARAERTKPSGPGVSPAAFAPGCLIPDHIIPNALLVSLVSRRLDRADSCLRSSMRERHSHCGRYSMPGAP